MPEFARPRECIFIAKQENTFVRSETPCLSQTQTQRAVCAPKRTIKFCLFPHFTHQIYLFCASPVSSCIMSHTNGFFPLCCLPLLYGFPLRLSHPTLTSTKAGTVCKPEAPCRLTAPEVRRKKKAWQLVQTWKRRAGAQYKGTSAHWVTR